MLPLTPPFRIYAWVLYFQRDKIIIWRSLQPLQIISILSSTIWGMEKQIFKLHWSKCMFIYRFRRLDYYMCTQLSMTICKTMQHWSIKNTTARGFSTWASSETQRAICLHKSSRTSTLQSLFHAFSTQIIQPCTFSTLQFTFCLCTWVSFQPGSAKGEGEGWCTPKSCSDLQLDLEATWVTYLWRSLEALMPCNPVKESHVAILQGQRHRVHLKLHFLLKEKKKTSWTKSFPLFFFFYYSCYPYLWLFLYYQRGNIKGVTSENALKGFKKPLSWFFFLMGTGANRIKPKLQKVYCVF